MATVVYIDRLFAKFLLFLKINLACIVMVINTDILGLIITESLNLPNR